MKKIRSKKSRDTVPLTTKLEIEFLSKYIQGMSNNMQVRIGTCFVYFVHALSKEEMIEFLD